RTRHLVTLGTPHRGTPWAYPGYLLGRVAPSLQQTVPGSPLLRDLTDLRFPAGVRLTSIYSRRDPLCPPSSCRLEVHRRLHLRNVEVPHGEHFALLFNAEISAIVCRELASGGLPGPGGTRLPRASRRAMVVVSWSRGGATLSRQEGRQADPTWISRD